MGASAIVAVRRAVVEAISELPEFADVEAMYAYTETTSREFLYTRDAQFEHKPASLRAGRTFRDEVGRFELVIFVQAVGGTPEDADDRALDLGLVVEEWVADNKGGVGGAQTLLIAGSGSLKEAAGDQASAAELVYPIRYNARLT